MPSTARVGNTFADAEDVVAAWQAATVSRRKIVAETLMTVTLLAPSRGAQTFRPDSMIRIEWRI